MCIEYRELNKVTIKNNIHYLVLMVYLISYKRLISFWKLISIMVTTKVRVKEDDFEKTVFRTRYWQYEFLVMSFGLTNAPTIFMDMINRVSKHFLDKYVLILIDDILIYSKSEIEHENHLR